jgi:hypothetical protein
MPQNTRGGLHERDAEQQQAPQPNVRRSSGDSVVDGTPEKEWPDSLAQHPNHAKQHSAEQDSWLSSCLPEQEAGHRAEREASGSATM